MRPLSFSYHPSRAQQLLPARRRHVVTEADVRVVLDRLPGRVCERLRAVRFNDRARGRRRLGYAAQESGTIALCALPPRISLASALRGSQSPAQFGALRGCQWPGLAVRRFMLYDVLLHELGHLQIIDEKAKRTRRKFAYETRAQEFADHWRRTLWSQPFNHPDPVHGPPSDQEREALNHGWRAAHGDYKRGLQREQSERYEEAVDLFTRAVERFPDHANALERLGLNTYGGRGTAESAGSAIELLSRAARLDPTLKDARLYLAMALGREDRQDEARRGFERAMQIDPYSGLAMSTYADALADWGCFDEAEAFFRQTLKKYGEHQLTLRDYARCLVNRPDPEGEANVGRAIELLTRAVAVDPSDEQSHCCLGEVLLWVEGEEERAIAHLQTALKLRPSYAKAAARLAEIEGELASPLK